jgi:predicted nucleic acid-binding protein
MAEYVIDASVAIKWVVKDEPFRDEARNLLREARLTGVILFA